MKPVNFFFLVGLILAVFPNKCLSDLVTETCDRTLYKDLCKSILQNKGGTDLLSLAAITLKTVNTRALSIQNQINALVKTSSGDIKKVLDDCSENFDDAVSQIKDSTTALSRKSYGDVLTWVSAAMTDADTCEDGFSEKKLVSPVADSSKTFSHICSIELTITNILSGKI